MLAVKLFLRATHLLITDPEDKLTDIHPDGRPFLKLIRAD